MTTGDSKAALKQLRNDRKATIDRARKLIKTQNKKFAAVKDQIASEAKTIPEIAAAVRMDAAEVLLIVSALKKFGEVAEGAKDGDYFRYQMTGPA